MKRPFLKRSFLERSFLKQRAFPVLLLLSTACAVPAEPLHPPGKRALYERVLTRPGALAAPAPAAAGGTPLKPMSRLYVFAREEAAGETWLRLGTGTDDASILGWLPAARTTPWKQQLTLAFTNPGNGRDPVLFLRGWDDLRAVLDSPDPRPVAAALRQSTTTGRIDPRVLAVEPATHIDIARRFYLLPILEHAGYRAATGEKIRALKVACVTLPDAAPAPTPAQAQTQTPASASPPSPTPVSAHYRAAVVFVIDSTISMRPYIDRTKAAVARFYDRIRAAGLLDRVAFGLVAFRAPVAEPSRARALGFVARVYADPAEVRDGRDFLKRVRDLGEATVATDRFDEDPYAGLLTALERPRWRRDFAERHLVLITDAGALDGSQRDATGRRVQSSTGLDALRIRGLAAEAGTSIAVLHLLTPEARRQGNTEGAADQYLSLAQDPTDRSSAYFPIADGSIDAFGAAVDAYAGRLIENLAGDAAEAVPVAARSTAGTAGDATAAQTAEIRSLVDRLGHAARLAYRGRVEGTRAPEVFEAWVSDRDLADPARVALEVRVLLTRNQLSDLQQVLREIVAAAEADLSAEPGTRRFFDRLASVAARFSVDPQSDGLEHATRLAELGLLGEYLEGLPYKSEVLTLTQDTWTRWGTMRQYEFIDRLNKKVRRYDLYYRDQDRWVDLSQTGTADPAEWVYPIPLTDLP